MIVDLVRNDLGRVCEYGSVEVPSLLALEHHPGLVHLVSTVPGRLRPRLGWAAAIPATFPPGSVPGAPTLPAGRKSVGEGKSVSVLVDLGGCRFLKKTKKLH